MSVLMSEYVIKNQQAKKIYNIFNNTKPQSNNEPTYQTTKQPNEATSQSCNKTIHLILYRNHRHHCQNIMIQQPYSIYLYIHTYIHPSPFCLWNNQNIFNISSRHQRQFFLNHWNEMETQKKCNRISVHTLAFALKWKRKLWLNAFLNICLFVSQFI